MILQLTARERELVVQALSNLAGEYRQISESSVSGYLSNKFTEDAVEIAGIAHRAADLAETMSSTQLDGEVTQLMRAGLKIEAIKLVRSQRSIGLKEAKDIVESIGRSAI